jgi:hypothetical protein
MLRSMPSGPGGGGHLDAPDVTPEEYLAAMPPRVREAFPHPADFPLTGWTEAMLWRVDRPAESVVVTTFAWLLDMPIWRWDGRRFRVSLRDVLDDPETHRAHHEKARRADLAYPIHITYSRGRWVILDGYHRLLKALLQGAVKTAVSASATAHAAGVEGSRLTR